MATKKKVNEDQNESTPVSNDLFDSLFALNPHLKQIYIDVNGDHHYNAFTVDGKLVSGGLHIEIANKIERP